MFKRILLTFIALAYVWPASSQTLGIDLQSTTAPGRVVPSLRNGEIAINRADRTLFFKNVDGTVGIGALMNATAAGRRAVEQGQADALTVGGTALPSALAARAPLASPAFSGSPSLSGPAATYRLFNLNSSNSLRFTFGLTDAPEGGGNAGSDFALFSYADNGSYTATPLVINRATGRATFGGGIGSPTIALSGTGSTGDVSGMSATPNAGGATNTLAKLFADRATLASPAFTGAPTAPTAAAGTNNTQLATTAFVSALGGTKANAAGQAFTGAISAPGISSSNAVNVTGGQINVKPSGLGGVLLVPGDSASKTGYLSFLNNDGSRAGYFGYADTGSKLIGLVAENGYTFNFNGPTPTVNGNGIYHGGNFNPATKADLAGAAFSGAVTAPSYNAAGLNIRSIGQYYIPYKPEWAATPGPERIQYQNLFELITSRDGDAWESPVAIEFRSRTGYNKSWVAGQSVAVGDNIVAYSPNPEPYVYRVTQAGTLGSTSPTAGPNSAEFANGTARLVWINYSNLAAKIAFTNTVVVSGNGGQTWNNNFNFIMNGLNGAPRFMTNTEYDFQNNSGYHCDLFSGITCNAITMFTGGSYRSTSFISMGALKGTTSFASEWGISMVGQNLIRDAAIEINVASKVGIGIGRYSGSIGQARFSESSIQDQSVSTEGLSLQGSYSNAAINISGTAPIGLAMGAGQKLCFFGGNNCFVKDNSQGKLLYQVGGVTVFSISDGGNVLHRGSINQSNNP